MDISEKEALLLEIEQLKQSREMWKQKAFELHNDLKDLGTFCILVVGLIRKIQPVNTEVVDFYKKYELDKIDMSKDENPKAKGKMGVMRWSAAHITDFPQIISGIKDLIHKFSPIVDELKDSHLNEVIYPAMGTLYKYISHSLNEDENQWFLSKIPQKQLKP